MKDIINKNSYKIKQIIKNITGEYNEDLEQEVYVKTYLNLSKYKEQNKFTQWISTTTANLCRDYLRSAYFKNKQKNDSEEETLNTIKSNETPEKIYSSKERQKIILKAINSLPKKMKEVIILYEFEEYSYEKIAQKLKIPQGTAATRQRKALKLLKLELE